MRTGLPLRSALFLAAAFSFVLAAAAPGAAQALKHQSNSVTILEDPVTAGFRKALNAISPALAGATRWQQADRKDGGAMTANSVTIDVPWSESRLTADRLTIGPDDIVLEGVRFSNGKGVFKADGISGPPDAFRSLAAFAFGEAQARQAAAPDGHGSLKITNFRLAAKPRARGDAHFSSSWSGASLAIDGLHCATAKGSPDACGLLAFTGLRAGTLDARSSFAGEAEMRIASLSLALTGDSTRDWSSVRQLASIFARPLDSQGEAIGADLELSGLHLVAKRGTGASGTGDPSRVDVETASLSIRRESSGGLRLKGDLDSRFSPDVAKGTPVWPALQQETQVAGPGDLLPLSAHVEVSYGDGHLAIAGLKADVAGLFDLDGSADATGLKELLAHGGKASGGQQGLAALAGVAIHSFSLVMHDKGLSDLVETAFHATPAELVREAAGVPVAGDTGAGKDAGSGNLMSLMTGGADMRSGLKTIIRKAAVDRISGILEQLKKTGKVELHCSSTPACISLAIASTD